MAKASGLIAGLVVFVVWLSMVGNPHVVETVIGLVIAVVTGFYVYRKAHAFSTRKVDPSKP